MLRAVCEPRQLPCNAPENSQKQTAQLSEIHCSQSGPGDAFVMLWWKVLFTRNITALLPGITVGSWVLSAMAWLFHFSACTGVWDRNSWGFFPFSSNHTHLFSCPEGLFCFLQKMFLFSWLIMSGHKTWPSSCSQWKCSHHPWLLLFARGTGKAPRFSERFQYCHSFPPTHLTFIP